MRISPFLADASGPYSSTLFALFLAFAIAAVIWLIAWLLSSGEEGKGTADGVSASNRQGRWGEGARPETGRVSICRSF